MSKTIIITSILSISIIATALIITNKPAISNNPTEQETSTLGATVVNYEDKQIVELTAKGGYSPAIVQASANKGTVLRVKTNNTFDCSSALSIPSLGINKMLPPTGSTDINIGAQQAGTQIDGTCSMGMYNFSIKFI